MAQSSLSSIYNKSSRSLNIVIDNKNNKIKYNIIYYGKDIFRLRGDNADG